MENEKALKNYILVEEYYKSNFEDKVNDLIKLGYVPCGNFFVEIVPATSNSISNIQYHYYQPMTLKDKSKEKELLND